MFSLLYYQIVRLISVFYQVDINAIVFSVYLVLEALLHQEKSSQTTFLNKKKLFFKLRKTESFKIVVVYDIVVLASNFTFSITTRIATSFIQKKKKSWTTCTQR